MIAGFYGIADLAPGDGPARAKAVGTLLVRGGASVLQLRQKRADARVLLENARALQGVARAAGVPLCVNDRLDVALACGAEACHLGQTDLPLASARAIARGRLRLGVSTHSLAQALEAAAGGADYLGFGPVFPTASKDDPDPVVGLQALAELCRRVAVPVVAIGGITPGRAPEVAATGACAAAVIGAVLRAPDPVAAGRAVAAAFSRPRGGPAPA